MVVSIDITPMENYRGRNIGEISRRALAPGLEIPKAPPVFVTLEPDASACRLISRVPTLSID
jgi:hypothetical protein